MPSSERAIRYAEQPVSEPWCRATSERPRCRVACERIELLGGHAMRYEKTTSAVSCGAQQRAVMVSERGSVIRTVSCDARQRGERAEQRTVELIIV